MNEVPVISPVELRSELDAGVDLLLVDVREPDELEISVLPNVVHIPMDDLASRFEEIPKDANIVMICRTGNRSGKTTDFLLQQGYTNVRNLATGMNGYATTVDYTMKTY